MALKVERDCVVANGNQRTRLRIDGVVPILRERDIMTPALPATRFYLVVQLMYTLRDPSIHHFALMHDLVKAAPSAWPHIIAISNHILAGHIYKEFKAAMARIAHEKELLVHATRGKDLRDNRQTDRQSA